MSLFISDAMAAAAPAMAGQNGGMGSIFMLLGFVVIFYLLFWLPQSRRAKEHRNLITNLAIGDEVITNGGILGKIKKVIDDFITITISENIDIKIQKTAIAATVPKGTFKTN